MQITTFKSVAVIGSGVAGAACARALMQRGLDVHVFDKSRGPGGRLATRRVAWVDPQGHARSARLDHGVVGITARSSAFQSFIDEALRAGWLAEWSPRWAAGSLAAECGERFVLPTPDLPSLCRQWLDGAAASWSFPVDGLQRGPQGWQVLSGDTRPDAWFDAVVLALPPAQAAPLIGPHRQDWARHASVVAMQPCWTLMGVAHDPAPALDWDLARPSTGPLAWVVRNDARPGRERAPGQACWVAHARSGWSRRHLEQTAEWVRQQLQGALSEWLGQRIDWQHSVVHRWRYALPPAHSSASAPSCWWDASLGLGACGDFLGGEGVEGAWRSAQALSAALLALTSHAVTALAAAPALATACAPVDVAAAATAPQSRRVLAA